MELTKQQKARLEVLNPLAAQGNEDAIEEGRNIFMFAHALSQAKEGDISSQLYVAHGYEWGIGIDIDYAEAFKWYNLAAEQDNPIAQFHVGRFYANGWAMKENKEMALSYFKKAALKKELKEREYEILFCIHDFILVYQEMTESCDVLLALAQQGNHLAQYKIGLFYAVGVKLIQNEKEALVCFKEAGRFVARASYYAGILLEQSHYYTKAFDWYRIAAQQNDGEAIYKMGYFYENGLGIDRNYLKAFECYMQAAEMKHIDAQLKVAFFYENGLGIEQDYNKALKLYLQLANMGNPIAQYKVGRFYEKGDAVEINYIEALKWYKLATEQGYNDGKQALKRLYSELFE